MDRSSLLPLHESRGLRLAERPEAPGHLTPLCFTDVPAEYRAARAGAALLDSSDRGRVTVQGRDAQDFLHRLLANHVKRLAVGASAANLLLSPKGKVQFAFLVRRCQDGYELSTPPGAAGGLAAALERFHFSEDVRITDSTAGHAPLELFGPRSAKILEELGALDPERGVLEWRGRPLELWSRPTGGYALDAGPAHVQALWEALCAAGATPVGLVVRDSLRVEACEALPGIDVDENVYPQEAGLEQAFALDKGCYVGQEVVAKIDTYGGLNKRLLTLQVEHGDPVPRGTRLVRTEEGERRELGLVTSWAYSFALDSGLVLAYVKRHHQEAGTRFELEGERGHARIVPPPAGSAAGT